MMCICRNINNYCHAEFIEVDSLYGKNSHFEASLHDVTPHRSFFDPDASGRVTDLVFANAQLIINNELSSTLSHKGALKNG